MHCMFGTRSHTKCKGEYCCGLGSPSPSLAPVSSPSHVDENEESDTVSLFPSEEDECLPLGQQAILRPGVVGQPASLCFRETMSKAWNF